MVKHNVENFYNRIADKYNWFFSSKEKVMERQVKQISEILGKYNAKTVLDCSCRNGMQAIELAKHGYIVDGGDISQEMVDHANRHATEQGVDITFKKADFRNLEQTFSKKYDVVLSWGNSIPHLLSDAELNQALKSLYNHIVDKGIALIEMRNYDLMLKDKPRFLPMRINEIKNGCRYSILYVFDYLNRKIRFNIVYLIEDLETGEKAMETESVDYNPLSKTHFTHLLMRVGFRKVITREEEHNLIYICEK